MTRICSWCRVVIGEKCSKCGGSDLSTIGEKLYKCQPCGIIFDAGDGGITHGLCDSCQNRPTTGS